MSEYLLVAIDLSITIAGVLIIYTLISQIKKTQLNYFLKFIAAACVCAALAPITVAASMALGSPFLHLMMKILPALPWVN